MNKTIIIKNNTNSIKTYAGQEIGLGEEHVIQSETIRESFAIDPLLNQDIWSTPAGAIINDGSNDLSPSEGDSWLKGISLAPSDEEGKPLIRTSVTKTSWHYEPRAIDFFTSKYNSIYNRKHDGATIDDGSDYDDATMVFYNGSGTELKRGDYGSDELFQQVLSTQCAKTVVYFEPKFAYEIFGATLNVCCPPEDRAYLWVLIAPHIPEEYGGSVPFMAGGLNLKMFKDGTVVKYDAKTSKEIPYDPVNHTGTIGLVVKHGLGVAISLQMQFEFYKG